MSTFTFEVIHLISDFLHLLSDWAPRTAKEKSLSALDASV